MGLGQYNWTFTARLLPSPVKEFLHIVPLPLILATVRLCFLILPFEVCPVYHWPVVMSQSSLGSLALHPSRHPPHTPSAACSSLQLSLEQLQMVSERHQGFAKQIFTETKTYRPAKSLLLS